FFFFLKKKFGFPHKKKKKIFFHPLVQYPGQVFTRARIVNSAFGFDFEGYERTIDTHIKNLRQKIEDDTRDPSYILTVYGVGYKFSGDKR
ncbi:MAG TPA: hypothetical protein DHM90_05335, partial [Clostridiaceae bacterium]|nr:hypothetical protein [Clostridiaceae bacterium]